MTARRPLSPLAPLLLALAACGGPDAGPGLTGAQLYELHGCAVCHGAGGEGRSLGPPLVGLAAHWERAALAEFLREPDVAVAADERLAEVARRFPSRMKPYRNTTGEERLRIADFVLSLGPE